MGQEDTALAALYAVINMCITTFIGFLLSKMGVLTPTTRGVVSALNYYTFVPLYGLMFIMRAIDRNSLNELGYVLFSSISSVVVAFIITVAIVFLMGSDIRYRFSYTFVVVYQNAIVMPQMLADTLCAPGGKYVTNFACKKSLVKPYCSLPMIYLNAIYWITVLPIIQNERRMANDLRKAFITVLNYYKGINEFLDDISFSSAKQVKFNEKEVEKRIHEKKGIKPTEAKANPPPKAEASLPTHIAADTPRPLMTQDEANKNSDPNIQARPEHLSPPRQDQMDIQVTGTAFVPVADEVPKDFDDKTFIKEFYERKVTKEDYERIMKHYSAFEETILNKKEHAAEKYAIEEIALKPEKLLEKAVIDDVFTFDFLKRRILLCPPAVWSVIGVILGFIFPFKEWFFDTSNKPLPTFIATLESVGGIMSPVSMFMLGTYIAQSALISNDMYIRWKHIILANVIRNIALPLIGLFWIFVVIKGMNITLFTTNPILMFIDYCYWIVPNGIILISVYVVADYFAKEFAVISIYLNLFSLPMMAVYIIIYFSVYDNQQAISQSNLEL